jgi:hypothetical protein
MWPFPKEKSMADTSYLTSDVFIKINHRLQPAPYRIDLCKHIKRVIKLYPDTGGGITFEPQDHQALTRALTDTKAFAKDDRGNFFGALASAATTGLGMREIGPSSVHWQIAPQVCNVHIDRWGFVMKDADGNTYYSPDAVQHIVDELMWAKIAEWAGNKLGSQKVYLMMRRVQPVVPNSSNQYQKLGLRLKLLDWEDKDSQQRLTISVDFSTSCLATCHDRDRSVGLTATYWF